jgi:hypothetical protein
VHPVLFTVSGSRSRPTVWAKALAAIAAGLVPARAFRRHELPGDLAWSVVLHGALWGFFAQALLSRRARPNPDLARPQTTRRVPRRSLGPMGITWYGGLIVEHRSPSSASDGDRADERRDRRARCEQPNGTDRSLMSRSVKRAPAATAAATAADTAICLRVPVPSAATMCVARRRPLLHVTATDLGGRYCAGCATSAPATAASASPPLCA